MHQDTTDLRVFSASLFGAVTVAGGVFTTGDTSIFTTLPPGMGMGTLPPGTYAFPPALNINYLRFTSTAAVVNDATTNLGLALVNSLMGGFDVYLTIATALVSSSTEPWVLQIRMLGPSTAPIIVEGPPVSIEFSPSSTDQVYVVHMGYFMQRGRFHDVQLSVSRGSAPIGDFIDIAAVYVYYPRQYNAAIYLDANVQSYSTDALVTYHRPTVAPNPSADVRSPGDVLRSAANVAYGDLSIHQAPNTGTIYGTFISSSIQYVAVTQNWSVQRRSAYVLPQ
jgi:hypothetical protein